METPITNTASEIKELVGHAQTIEAYRISNRMSISSLVKKFLGLGTDKTWNKILRGDLTELNASRWLETYRMVINTIRLETDRPIVEEELYGELSAAIQLESAFMDAMKETGNARFILMVGDTGMGKSSAKQLLVKTYGDRIICVEATAVWRDRPMAYLGAILNALGMENPPVSIDARLRSVMDRLKERRLMVLTDEGHHLGPDCLNTIKTLINGTPGEFAVLAMKTLWKRLEKEAYEEARQLTGNRLAALIDLTLGVDDIREILARRVVWTPDADLEAMAVRILPRAPSKGNLALAREVAKLVNEMRRGEPADAETFLQALASKGGAR